MPSAQPPYLAVLLLLYTTIFFTTPTACTTTTVTRYYNTLPEVANPYNTHCNSNWVLRCGDVHPNPSHRRIYQLRWDCRLVPGPSVPVLDIEEDDRHLAVDTNRHYNDLDKATKCIDRDI